ncbi:hypothetical protein CES85_1842 [Ochrobactrum quorumnocens]|uniref:Uncharacterized protein n=1 Tax=Ochrobactrum quorumnocens TaxID=271865 RepID=A0A248UIL5_9HYPH|nr:hypothetical protein CES85_1842 [[Ochrobactrum] quorumnocens]
MAQDGDQLFIQLVHDFSNLKYKSAVLIKQNDKFANPYGSHRQGLMVNLV